MAQQKWWKEKILEEIQYLHQLGKDLSHSRVQATNPKLTSAAIRYFGSWKNAVEAANVDYEAIRERSEEARAQKVSKWSCERIIQEIHSLQQAEEDIRASVIEKKYPALFSSASRYFGGWQQAIAAAGIDYAQVKQAAKVTRQKNRLWSRMLILDRISEMIVDNESIERAYIQGKYPALYEMTVTYFGSWDAALKQLEKDRPLQPPQELGTAATQEKWMADLVEDKISGLYANAPDRSRLQDLLKTLESK